MDYEVIITSPSCNVMILGKGSSQSLKPGQSAKSFYVKNSFFPYHEIKFIKFIRFSSWPHS